MVSLTLGVLASCATASTVSLDKLLARHAHARGGAARVEAVRSMRVRLRVQEPKFTVDITYVADRSGRVRVDVFAAGKRVYAEGVDERGGWALGQGGTAHAVGREATAALEHGRLFNLYGLHELPGLGHRLVIEKHDAVRGRRYDVVRVEMADGFKTWFFLDVRTGRLELRRDFRAIHPDVDPRPIWIESRYSDFRTVDGVVSSFKSEQYALETEAWLQTTHVVSTELNPSLAEEDLRRPGAEGS